MKRERLILYLVLFLVVLSLSAQSVLGTIWHMATDGVNNPNCDNIATPCADLNYILDPFNGAGLAQPGDTVYVHSGTYSNPAADFLESVRGAPGAWITITGAPGEPKPIFQDYIKFTCFWGDIQYEDSAYLIIKDIKFSGYSHIGQAISIDDCGMDIDYSPAHDIIIENIEVENIGLPTGVGGAIKLGGVDNFVVRNCTFINTPKTNIDMVGCHYGEVYNNRIFGYYDPNIDLWLNTVGILAKGASRNIDIHHNWIDTSYVAISNGGSADMIWFRPYPTDFDDEGMQVLYDVKNVSVYSNVVIDALFPLFFAWNIGGSFYNNIVYSKYPYGVESGSLYYVNVGRPIDRCESEGVYAGYCRYEPQYGEVKNNLFYVNLTYGWSDSDRQTRSIFFRDSWTTTGTFNFSNNLFYMFGSPSYSCPDWDNLQYIQNGGPPEHQDNICGLDYDPLLVDPHNHDFQLQEGSPAIGAGIPIDTVDYDYEYNPFNVPPSIGAYEYELGQQLPPDSPIWPSAQTSSFILGPYTRFAPEAEEMLDWIVNHYDLTIGIYPLNAVKAAGPDRIVLGGSHVSFWTYYNYTDDSYKWNMQELKGWVEANWQSYAWSSQFSNAAEALEDCFAHVTEDMTLTFFKGGSLSITAYDPADPTRSRLPGPWDLNYDWIMNLKSPVYRAYWQDFKAVEEANNNGDGYFLDVQSWPRTEITDFSKIREFSSHDEYLAELTAMTGLIKDALHQTYPNKFLAGNTYDYFKEGVDPPEFYYEDELDVNIREGSIRYAKAAELFQKEIETVYRVGSEGKIVTMQHTAHFTDWVCGSTPECLARDRMAGLAAYYLAMNDNVYFFTLHEHSPDDPRVNSWFEAITYDIGEPLNQMYLFAEGPDPSSTTATYKIFTRDFTKGKVLLKPRPDWSATVYGDLSATVHDLPGTYRPLNADGTLGNDVTSISLRNWEGAILIGYKEGDVNLDGWVNLEDLALVSQAFGCTSNCGNEDTNSDNQVNVLDLIIVGKNFT